MLIVLDRIRPYEQIKAELETSRQFIEKASQMQAQSQLTMGLSHEIRNPLACENMIQFGKSVHLQMIPKFAFGQ